MQPSEGLRVLDVRRQGRETVLLVDGRATLRVALPESDRGYATREIRIRSER